MTLSAMRASFETMLALVSAVTVPVCLVEAGSAAPLIGLVYGTRWLPAHQPLTWLALLAALQIFFQLTLDYFVVLARSRMIFTLQLAWLDAPDTRPDRWGPGCTGSPAWRSPSWR